MSQEVLTKAAKTKAANVLANMSRGRANVRRPVYSLNDQLDTVKEVHLLIPERFRNISFTTLISLGKVPALAIRATFPKRIDAKTYMPVRCHSTTARNRSIRTMRFLLHTNHAFLSFLITWHKMI
jgi:hypothetical protein